MVPRMVRGSRGERTPIVRGRRDARTVGGRGHGHLDGAPARRPTGVGRPARQGPSRGRRRALADPVPDARPTTPEEDPGA